MGAEGIASADGQRETVSIRGRTPSLEFLVLSETTAAHLLWAGWRGRPACIAAVLPYLRASTGILERLAAWAIRRGWARPIDDALPVHDRYPGDSLFLPLHPELETKLHQLLRVDRPNAVECEYAYALRKALSDYTQVNLLLLGIISWAARHWPEGGWRLRGAPRHLDRLRAWHGGDSVSRAPIKSLGLRLVNLGNSIVTVAGVLFWLLLRTRLKVTPQRYRLAIDRISPIDLVVARSVIDDPREVLIVERSRTAAAAVDATRSFRSCVKEDARLTPKALIILGSVLVRDVALLYRRYGALDGGLFGRFAALAGKRAMFAAFFSRFQPDVFWCRDDYSMDHIIRSQELRKIGSRSLGISHGLPINTYISQWREIDFDVYYVYGRHLYEHFYRGAWPSTMLVKPVGNIQFTRTLRAACAKPRGNDIAFFAIVTPRFDFVMEQIMKIARRFSDRTVHIRMKGNRDAHYRERFAYWMSQMPTNVSDNTDPDPYTLMSRVAYALTPGSTTGAEALQFGAKGFVFDVEPSYRWFYYRNFPGLTVRDADEVIQRIEAIESGAESYDFSRYDELIEMSGQDIFEIIRADIATPSERAA